MRTPLLHGTLREWSIKFRPLLAEDLRRGTSARIVNVSSEAGSLASIRGTPAYSVSKAALNALTVLLAGELRGENILVNAVCPGWVATDLEGAGGRPVSDGASRCRTTGRRAASSGMGTGSPGRNRDSEIIVDRRHFAAYADGRDPHPRTDARFPCVDA